jgi:hypothetical protein
VEKVTPSNLGLLAKDRLHFRRVLSEFNLRCLRAIEPLVETLVEKARYLRARLRFAAICGQAGQKILAPSFPSGMLTSKDVVIIFEWVITKRTCSVPSITFILPACRWKDIMYELH